MKTQHVRHDDTSHKTTQPTMKQLTTLIFTLALSTLAYAGERAAPMSDQDWSAFEAKCQTNPQCAPDLAKLKGAMDQYEAELKAVCDKDSGACAQRMDKEAQEQRERFARCDDPATCIDTLNRDMEQHELKLERSSWCAKRPSNCGQQRKARDERQAKSLHWCDSCEKAGRVASSGCSAMAWG